LPKKIGKALTIKKMKKFDEKIKKRKNQQLKFNEFDKMDKKIAAIHTKELHARLIHMLKQTNPEAQFISNKQVSKPNLELATKI
jgi:hypothetical protein